MTTRFRIILSSITIPLLFIFLTALNINNPFFVQYKSLIITGVLALLEMLFVAWIVSYKLRGERLFTVLVFPALSLAVVISFISVLITSSGSDLDKFSTATFATIALFIITYILSANINILNLAAIDNIPLGQAGRAVHYVLTMMFSYFFFVLLISWDINYLLKSVIVFLFIFTYTFVALWTISLAYKQRITSTIGISTILTFVFFILGLWPLDSFYFALFMVLIFYMCLGVALEIREIIGKWIWYEYAILFLIILVLLLATAKWGIDGTII